MDIDSFYSSQQELLQQQAELGMLWEYTNKSKTAHWPLHWYMHGGGQSTFLRVQKEEREGWLRADVPLC